MKKRLFVFSIIPLLLLASCAEEGKDDGGNATAPFPSYKEKSIDVYRKKDIVDKSIKVRFFDTLPHVPYIGVGEYFEEFFNTKLEQKKQGYTYYFSNKGESYLAFDALNNTFTTNDLYSFNDHPDFKPNTGKSFIKTDGTIETSRSIRTIELDNYHFAVYGNGEKMYAPVTFLSAITGALAAYTVAYNGKNLYVFDFNGLLGEATNHTSFGNSYGEMLDNASTPRESDLAEYNYNELCFVFDNLRGYTEQLEFGDNNLLSLGLNGLLEQYYPKIKEWLLSTDKKNYFESLFSLFSGLWDGGHTGLFWANYTAMSAYKRRSEQVFSDFYDKYQNNVLKKQVTSISFNNSRKAMFGDVAGNYYLYNNPTKTAYIGFNQFVVDYDGWNAFYNGKGNVPVHSDTYAFIRDKLYQANTDGAENVVLDLTTNGGGNSEALEGIVGLLNGAKSDFSLNDTFNRYRKTERHSLDVNLDGKFDNKDVEEANKFKFNVGVLTSEYSFSCGNLLPSVLKELGYKTLGERSGGGSCAVGIQVTADGCPYQASSYICLSNRVGENIDSGVPVDFNIARGDIIDEKLGTFVADDFYNFELVADYLSHAYEG